MSTEICDFESTLIPRADTTKGFNLNIRINRFSGGAELGPMLQITIGDQFVTLTKKQAVELSDILGDSFNYERYPSE